MAVRYGKRVGFPRLEILLKWTNALCMQHLPDFSASPLGSEWQGEPT